MFKKVREKKIDIMIFINSTNTTVEIRNDMSK